MLRNLLLWQVNKPPISGVMNQIINQGKSIKLVFRSENVYSNRQGCTQQRYKPESQTEGKLIGFPDLPNPFGQWTIQAIPVGLSGGGIKPGK